MEPPPRPGISASRAWVPCGDRVILMLRWIVPSVGGSASPVRRGRQPDVTVSVNNVSGNHT
jgi:hypothetical protein